MKKKIAYTAHLKLRMKVRNIPENLPREICKKAKEKYMDTKTGYNITVKKVLYKGKVREMAVVYEEIKDTVKIITIHPLKAYEKEARIRIGRWNQL